MLRIDDLVGIKKGYETSIHYLLIDFLNKLRERLGDDLETCKGDPFLNTDTI